MSTYTIMICSQNHHDENQNPDWVTVICEDESRLSRLGFEFKIDPVEFDSMTDDAFYERVKNYCANWQARVENRSVININAARDARMAGYVGDKVTV